MIKIKFKNKILKENLPRYSKNAKNQILDLTAKGMKQPQTAWNEIINIPLKEIISSSDKELLNGLPLFMELTVNKKDISFLNNIFNPETKRFDEKNTKEYLNLSLPILYVYFNVDSEKKDIGAFTVRGKNGKNYFSIVINPLLAKNNLDVIESSVEHELIHLSQIVNSYCMIYSQQLNKSKSLENIQELKLEDFGKYSNRYGGGKHVQDPSYKTSQAKKINSYTEWEKYISDSDEYKPWLSDGTNAIIRWLKEEPEIFNKWLLAVKFKEQYNSSNPSQRLEILKKARKNNINLNSKISYEDISNYVIKRLFSEPQLMNYIDSLSNNFKDFINFFDESAMKFLRKDLVLSLSKKLKQYTETTI